MLHTNFKWNVPDGCKTAFLGSVISAHELHNFVCSFLRPLIPPTDNFSRQYGQNIPSFDRISIPIIITRKTPTVLVCSFKTTFHAVWGFFYMPNSINNTIYTKSIKKNIAIRNEPLLNIIKTIHNTT